MKNAVERNKQNQFARECIVSALMQLLRQKPLSAITIKELCERAGVSRMTFYRNYDAKEDILLSHIQDILARYQREDRETAQEGQFYDRARVRRGFSYFYQYKDFVDGLVHCGLGEVFLQKLTAFALEKWLQDETDRVQRYRLVSYVGLLFNCYMTWIQAPQDMTLDALTELVFSFCEKAYM